MSKSGMYHTVRRENYLNLLADMNIFGCCPLTDPLFLVRCRHCERIIRSARFCQHMRKIMCFLETLISMCMWSGACACEVPKMNFDSSPTTFYSSFLEGIHHVRLISAGWVSFGCM